MRTEDIPRRLWRALNSHGGSTILAWTARQCFLPSSLIATARQKKPVNKWSTSTWSSTNTSLPSSRTMKSFNPRRYHRCPHVRVKLESANVAARNAVDTNSDGTTGAGKTTTCAWKEMERGHLTNLKAMTPENDDKCKRDQTYRIKLKKKLHTQSTLLDTRTLQKEGDWKKGIRALPKLIACTILLQGWGPTKLSKDSPRQKNSSQGELLRTGAYLALKIMIQRPT